MRPSQEPLLEVVVGNMASLWDPSLHRDHEATCQGVLGSLAVAVRVIQDVIGLFCWWIYHQYSPIQYRILISQLMEVLAVVRPTRIKPISITGMTGPFQTFDFSRSQKKKVGRIW